MRSATGVVILLGLGCSAASDPPPAVCASVGGDGQIASQMAGPLVVAPDEEHVAFLRDPHDLDAGCLARGAQLRLGTLVVLALQSDGTVCERVVGNDVSISSVAFSSDSRDLVFKEGIDRCGVGRLKTADADGANLRLVHGAVSSEVSIGSTVFFTVDGDDRRLAAPLAGGPTIAPGGPAESDTPEHAANATGTAFVYRKPGKDSGGLDESLLLVALPYGKSQVLVDGVKDRAGTTAWSPGGNSFCRRDPSRLRSAPTAPAWWRPSARKA